MSSTMTPMIPGLSLAAANPRSIHRLRGSPQYLMWPALNFSVRCRCPVSFPAITTRQPFAPASMIRRTVEWPARRKCQPRSRAFASFSAIICALSAGLPTSWTSICGLSNLNWRSTASVRLLIAPPFLPITSPGRSARSVTRVPIGVRWMSRPPKPARRVSLIKYSLSKTRRTFSTMIRLSFRSIFDSRAISDDLLEHDFQVHGIRIPRTAPAVRSRPEGFRRRPLVRVDYFQDHRIRVFLSRELRVRDGALENLEEPLRRFDGIPGGPRPGFVGHPSIVFPHRHGLFEGDHGLQVFARLVNGLPPQLSRQLDGLLPREREVSTIGSSHRLDLVFNRVPAFRHRPHFSGMNFDVRAAPTPGPLWTTAFRVIANSPMSCPIISALISTVTNSFPLWTATFLPMKSGKIGTSRQWVRTASSVPFARSFSTNVRRSSSKPRMNERRGLAGSSSMISSRVIAFISSSVYPR